jgi:hypothetical protein
MQTFETLADGSVFTFVTSGAHYYGEDKPKRCVKTGADHYISGVSKYGIQDKQAPVARLPISLSIS